MSYVPAMCTAGVALTLTAAAAVGGSWVRESLADDPPTRLEQTAPDAEPGFRYELPVDRSSTTLIPIEREARMSLAPPGPSFTANPDSTTRDGEYDAHAGEEAWSLSLGATSTMPPPAK